MKVLLDTDLALVSKTNLHTYFLCVVILAASREMTERSVIELLCIALFSKMMFKSS